MTDDVSSPEDLTRRWREWNDDPPPDPPAPGSDPTPPPAPPPARPVGLAWSARSMGASGVALIVALTASVAGVSLHHRAAALQDAGPVLAPAQTASGAGTPTTPAGHQLRDLLSDVIPPGKYSDLSAAGRTMITAEDSVPITVPNRSPEMMMVDRDPRTAWQTPGDGVGRQITVSFWEPRTVAQVGLINGYAGAEYSTERRLLEVRWSFDNGQTVEQTLRDDDQDAQVEDIPPVTTSTVTLTLLKVTGTPPNTLDDYTAISELELSGWVS